MSLPLLKICVKTSYVGATQAIIEVLVFMTVENNHYNTDVLNNYGAAGYQLCVCPG